MLSIAACLSSSDEIGLPQQANPKSYFLNQFDMNSALLDAAVLDVLQEHAHPAPERYIMLALAVSFRLKPTFTELRESLSRLEERQQLVGLRSHDSILLWSITDMGRSTLSEIKHS